MLKRRLKKFYASVISLITNKLTFNIEFEGTITVGRDEFFKEYLEIFNSNKSYYCNGEVKVKNLPAAAYRCYEETSYADVPGNPTLEKRHRDQLYS